MENLIVQEDWNQLQLAEKDIVNANLNVELAKTKLELVRTQLIMKYDIKPNDKIDPQTRMIERSKIQLKEVPSEDKHVEPLA